MICVEREVGGVGSGSTSSNMGGMSGGVDVSTEGTRAPDSHRKGEVTGTDCAPDIGLQIS